MITHAHALYVGVEDHTTRVGRIVLVGGEGCFEDFFLGNL